MRVVVDPATGAVVVDPQRNRPGRGAYLHPDAGCIDRALARKVVSRALRSPGCGTGVLSELAAAYAKDSETA